MPRSLALGLLGLRLAADLSAQTPRTGLLVVAHGATPGWNARVRETVTRVRWDRGPVAVAFLMGEEATSAGWNNAVRQLTAAGATELVVVPLMVSTFGDHVRQIEHYAGVRPELPPELADHDHRDGVATPVLPMRVTAALDAAPELGAILLDGWRQLPAADRARPILLLAHGPQAEADAVRWERNLAGAAEVLSAGGAVGELRIGLVRDDATPAGRARAVATVRDTVAALAGRARDSVVVLPILISTGSLDRVKLPGDLAGLPVAMRPMPLAPSPRLARWIERVAGAAASDEVGVQAESGRASQ